MSNETRVLLDPTSERNLSVSARAPRIESLEKRTIGLLDISKTKGDVFLDRVEFMTSLLYGVSPLDPGSSPAQRRFL